MTVEEDCDFDCTRKPDPIATSECFPNGTLTIEYEQDLPAVHGGTCDLYDHPECAFDCQRELVSTSECFSNGTLTLEYKKAAPAMNGGAECGPLYEHPTCAFDCVFSRDVYTDGECLPSGKTQRTYTVTTPAAGTGTCNNKEMVPCVITPVNCVLNFNVFSDGLCVGGSRTRTYQVVTPARNGGTCIGETVQIPCDAGISGGPGIMPDFPEQLAKDAGFEICYQDKYSNNFDTTKLKNNCNRNVLMVACRPVGTTLFTLAATGLHSEVLLYPSTSIHMHNNVQWYYGSSSAFGFAPAGVSINLTPCDENITDQSDKRLCIVTSGSGKGYRCGNTLTSTSGYERIVLHRHGAL